MPDDSEFDAGLEPERWDAPLEACPYCPTGTEVPLMWEEKPRTQWYRTRPTSGWFQVRCRFCGARGPNEKTHYRAAAEWSHVSDMVWK